MPILAGVGAKVAPLRITGLVAWFDFADTETILPGTGVAAIQNKAGNAAFPNLAQGTGSLQPLTGTRTQNSRNVADFDGTDDFLQTGNLTLAQPFTVFIVCGNDDGADGSDQRNFAASSTILAGGKTVTTNTWRLNCGTALVGGTADTAANYFTYICNGASSVIRKNAAAVASGNAGSNGFSAEGFRLGRTNGAGSQYWDGWIGDALVYNTALSASEYGVVEDYLAGKWAI